MSKPHQIQDNTTILERHPIRGIVKAAGITVPTSGSVGYAPGCLFTDMDASAGSTLYINNGTRASASFVPFTGVDLSGLLATADEINSTSDASTREVLAGATLAVTQALHDGRTIRVPAVSAITLPAFTGSGARYRFVGAVTATAVTITATAAELFGNAFLISDNSAAVVGFNAAGSTTITMAGTVNGGIKGWIVEIEDVATSIGIVRMNTLASGSEQSPFS
jgi:hypothetical protein